MHQALAVLWEAADRICGKRLRVLLPVLIEAMERHGHLQLDPVVRSRLLDISAATIDRLLRPEREATGRMRRRRWGTGSAVRQSVPVRTFADWGDPPPGYFECDLVEHCGGVKNGGNFVHTLTLTDIHSGWTECVALVVREQSLVVEGISAVAKCLPFALRGLDTDNDSAFMNETLQGCQRNNIEWTRSRAYRKNDQAWVEQKNGAVVRRLAGYGRLSGLAAAPVLQRLYESARLYVNFFQPSFKLASKQRDGALVRKRYHPPLAPYQRLLASDRIDETVKHHLREQFAALDPVALLTTIRAAQHELSILTNRDAGAAGSPDQPEYLAAFATAWHSDYRAPKGQRKNTTKHWWRSRADPFVESWPMVEGWLSGGTQSRRRGTADPAEATAARPLPNWRAAPDLAAARKSLARRACPRTGVCGVLCRADRPRISPVVVKPPSRMLDARINQKNGSKEVEKNTIAKCEAKHSGYRGLTHTGGFSHGGRGGQPSSHSTPAHTTTIIGSNIFG